MSNQRTLELIRKLRAHAKSKGIRKHERRAFNRKAEALEFRHFGKWSWWRLTAMAIQSKEVNYENPHRTKAGIMMDTSGIAKADLGTGKDETAILNNRVWCIVSRRLGRWFRVIRALPQERQRLQREQAQQSENSERVRREQAAYQALRQAVAARKFFCSAEREQLIRGSTEQRSGLFVHPAGVYIVRGPKGGSKAYFCIEDANDELDNRW